MKRHNKASLVLGAFGTGGLAASIAIPSSFGVWMWIGMLSIYLLIAALIVYYLGSGESDELSDDDDLPERTDALADAVTASVAKAEQALALEHRLETGYYDSYGRTYALECDCGHRCSAVTLELAGRLMDRHHDAFVRYALAIRTVQDLGSSILDLDPDLGSNMDADWRTMSEVQRKEMRLLSTEIGWRMDARSAVEHVPHDDRVFSKDPVVPAASATSPDSDDEPFGSETIA